MSFIRKADLENHNRDGGLWILLNNKVYDIQDLRYVYKEKFNIHFSCQKSPSMF